uniref:Uncharacterized protein orf n=1 Tax=Arabidopsis thaliana TaxID=3702 RepID=O48596_ARATH|nr:hypothetical protein [Arabidopsis thaliana]
MVRIIIISLRSRVTGFRVTSLPLYHVIPRRYSKTFQYFRVLGYTITYHIQ